MTKPFIIVPSINHAMKGKKILEDYHIQSDIERVPRGIRKCGCGYCLRVSYDEANMSVVLLKENGVMVEEVKGGGAG